MTMPLIISFFTIGTPYETEVQRLTRSCERFGLEYLIVPVEPKGSWERNCAMKGPFVQEQLERAQRAVLWIDADGEVVAPLDYFDRVTFDLGCYVRWSIRKEPPALNSPDPPFMSGTIFVNYTEAGRKVAACWADQCRQYPDRWDQMLLGRAWWRLKSEIKFRLLPQGYCKVSDRIWREQDERPFILHYQASRRFKHEVNRRASMKGDHDTVHT